MMTFKKNLRPRLWAILAVLFTYTCDARPLLQSIQLPIGTTVLLETAESLDASQIVPGQVIELLVRDDIYVEGLVLVAAGARGMARVAEVQPGDAEEAGYCTIEAYTCMAVDGQNIALGGTAQRISSDSPGAQYSIESGMALAAETFLVYAIELVNTTEAGDSTAFSVQFDPEPRAEAPLILPAGMDIPLVMSDECIPGMLSEGAIIRLRVSEDVKVGEHIVIHAKAPASGRVKYLKEGQIFVVATHVTTADGMLLAVETDNSVKVEYDPEQDEELLPLKAAVPAQLRHAYQVRVQ